MQGFFQGISFRLAKVGVIVALAVGFFISAIQIYIDFQAESTQVNSLLSRIMAVSTPPAARAVHTLDNTLAAEVATGLMQYDFIVAVSIQDELGNELASSGKLRGVSKTLWLTRHFTDDLRIFEAPLGLPETASSRGKISFVVDMDAAYSAFYDHALIIISIGLIRSSILVILLFIAFYYLLTKPLIRIARDMQAINPGSPGEQRIAMPTKHENDELSQLVDSGNQMLDAVDLALAKRRAVEVVLRKSEEHVRQIIDSLPVWVGARNADGHYIFANKALADFVHSTPEAMRGSHVREFAGFFQTDPAVVLQKDKDVIEGRVQNHVWEDTWVGMNGQEHQMHTYVMPMDFYDETVALVVSSDITELKRTQAQMEHMAYHDALTDLPNRSYLVERLEEELRKAAHYNYFGALLFIDLDQFKNINDSLGHPVGDGVLKHVAQRLITGTKEGDVVVRLGGDEFVVILTNVGKDLASALLHAEEVGERLRRFISEPYFHNDLQLHVTSSVGVVIFPEEDAGVHELLRYADAAMYQVKEQGRNAVKFFNKHMADNARNVLVMEGDLHSALENHAFELYFQPRVDIPSDRVVGAEALLRWSHPERGPVSPMEFIPIMETSGLVVEVGMWVLEETIARVQEWQRDGLWQPGMRASINISPRQFKSQHFVQQVQQAIERANFDPSCLEMEITEGIVIHNLEETVETMRALMDLGIHFALDDFGTGYSSISYLKRLPVSILKIDQTFVRDITLDKNDRALVETISAMGKMLELDIVAEGVETEEQLDLIRSYGCRFYQGYLCSRPLAPQQFREILANNKAKTG